jgi:Transposase IS116/IS110/IS902 family
MCLSFCIRSDFLETLAAPPATTATGVAFHGCVFPHGMLLRTLACHAGAATVAVHTICSAVAAHARTAQIRGPVEIPVGVGRIEKMAKQTYPETALLKQVTGVGDLIATTYVLTIEDPHRFRKSRDAGCFVGLQPGRRNSGESEPQMRISKEGTSTYEHCWCKEPITFWDRLGKTVTCDAGGGSSRGEEGKPPRSERWWRWHGS